MVYTFYTQYQDPALSATYRAFLSYSHSDARFASKLHTDLEAWRIDRDLVGRETPMGVVPRTLRPIFRDREDFAGGGVLSDATERALAESASLVVLCSPTAARSAYVNEEIQRFKAMGKASSTSANCGCSPETDSGRSMRSANLWPCAAPSSTPASTIRSA